jgi:hypothetical protein
MIRAVVVAVALALPVVSAAPATLTPADIEKVSGLKGVHLVTETARGSVPGRDNYADATGKLVLWFHSMPAALFARAKTQPVKMMSEIVVEPKLFHVSVAGLGDEAFDSPDGKTQHAIYVRKGDAAFGLISNVDATGKPIISMPQLTALARIVLARM